MNIFSNRLKKKIAKKCIPDRLILCHGRKCKKYPYLRKSKNLYLDFRSVVEPDITASIHNIHKMKLTDLKSKFKFITSVHAPILIFFNRPLSYLNFSSTCESKNKEYVFHNKKNKMSVRKILQSNYYFCNDFLKSLLYLLQVGGSFEFTDNFIFENRHNKNCTITDTAAIKIIKKFLGNKSQYFDVSIETKSNCIDYSKKAKIECLDKRFIVIKKVK
jgi:hypothetical protein